MELDETTAVTAARMKVAARKHHCNSVKSRPCMESDFVALVGSIFALVSAVPGEDWAEDSRRRRITLERMIKHSQINHGSATLLATTLPMISSENIWPTRAVRQSFSRSSVGRRRAKTP